MKILHMGGFSQSELIQYKNAMRGNVIDAMATVLREINSNNIEFQFEVKKSQITCEQTSANYLKSFLIIKNLAFSHYLMSSGINY